MPGPVDHPAYLARQTLRLGSSATQGAGAQQYNSAGIVFPFDVRIRNAVALAQTQGAAGHGAVIFSTGTVILFPTQNVVNSIGTVAGTFTGPSLGTALTGTNTLGFVPLGTSTVAAQSGDMNFRLPAGQPLLVKNGTSVTGTYELAIEWHIDPQTATWTGTN